MTRPHSWRTCAGAFGARRRRSSPGANSNVGRQNGEQDHWSGRGRAMSFGDSGVTGRPRRSVPSLGGCRHMNTKALILSLLFGCQFLFAAQAQTTQSVPTSSLSFHLRSLGRTPTQDERGVIEAALALMWRHGCRSDYPLRSIKHEKPPNDWVLLFDSGVPDGGFQLYLRDEKATWFEVHFAGTSWRSRFPAETRKKK